MRCSRFFIALALGLTTAALTFSELSPATAQEAAVSEAAGEATDAANDTADAATDAANDSADAATDAANDTAEATTEAANDTAEATSDAAGAAANTANDATNVAANAADNAAGAAAEATTNAANQASQSTKAQRPAGSAGVDANISGRTQPNIQGSAGAQTRLDAQGRPLPNTSQNGQVGTQQQSNSDLNTNAGARLNAQQPGQLQANGQLSAEAIDQRLGLQFDQAVRTSGQGLSISTIQPNSVFYNSGLRQGDVLMSVDNRPFTNRAEFARLITTYQQNRIPLIVMRNGQRQTIYFTRPADFVIHQQQPSQAILGVTFDSSKGGSAVVRAVTPDSPAERAGIMTGDVITGVNGKPVLAAHEVVDMIGSMQPGQQVTIDYSRNEQKLRAETVLAARAQLERHTVGYAPAQSVLPTVPAPPVNQPVLREDTTYRAQPTSPGDPDGDGLRLDGDGRIPRRVLNRR